MNLLKGISVFATCVVISLGELRADANLYKEPPCGPQLIIRHEMRAKGLLGKSCQKPISQVRIDGADVFGGNKSEGFFGPRLKYGAIKCGEAYAVKVTPGYHKLKVFVENDYNKEYEVTVPESSDYEWTMFNNSIGGLVAHKILTKSLGKCDYCCEAKNVGLSKTVTLSLDDELEDLAVTNIQVAPVYSGDIVKISGELFSGIEVKARELEVVIRIFNDDDVKIFDTTSPIRKGLAPGTTVKFNKTLSQFGTENLKGRCKVRMLLRLNKKVVFESSFVSFTIKQKP